MISAQMEVILPMPQKWASRARFSMFFDIGNVFSTTEIDFFDKIGNPIDYGFEILNGLV